MRGLYISLLYGDMPLHPEDTPSPSGSRPLATGSRPLARCRGIWEASGLEPRARHRSHFGSRYALGGSARIGLLFARVRALPAAQTRLAAARRREVLPECKPDATREPSKQNTTRGRVAQESRLAVRLPRPDAGVEDRAPASKRTDSPDRRSRARINLLSSQNFSLRPNLLSSRISSAPSPDSRLNNWADPSIISGSLHTARNQWIICGITCTVCLLAADQWADACLFL